MEGRSNLFSGKGGGGGRKSVTVFKVHGKLFRRIAVLESALTQFALPAMLTNGLHCAVSPHCAAAKRAEIERITTAAVEARGADPRAHANERDEKEARHSSFNYKFH